MTRHIILAALVAVAAGGCTSRFIADFEADTAGALPDTHPAGAPDDQIFVLEGGGDIAVSNAAPLVGSQSLRIGGPGSDGANAPNAFMYAEEINDPSQRVYASWRGRLDPGAAARIFFWSGHFNTIVEIVLEDGEIRVAGDEIGSYTPGQPHTILINANPATDQFGMSAFGGVSAGTSASGPVANPAAFPDDNIGLTFQLIGGGSGAAYRVDTVRMSERRPDEEVTS